MLLFEEIAYSCGKFLCQYQHDIMHKVLLKGLVLKKL